MQFHLDISVQYFNVQYYIIESGPCVDIGAWNPQTDLRI